MSICNFDKCCICVFVYLQVRHQGTLFLRSSCHYLFKNIAHVMSICNFDQCCICVFVYLCICVFVFVYLQARHPETLFLRSSCNYLFKNIAHVMSISNFWPSSICVFVYLCICICVFGRPRLSSDRLELFVTSPFSSIFLSGHYKCKIFAKMSYTLNNRCLS